MNIVFIFLMAIAFSYRFGGNNVNVFLKYTLALLITIYYFTPILTKDKKIKGVAAFYIKNYMYPIIAIFIWTIFVWCVKTPEGLVFSDITRMTSSLIYLALSVLSAIALVGIWGDKAIKYSVWAIFISIMANFIYSTYLCGFGLLKEYLVSVMFNSEFEYGSALEGYSGMLEVGETTFSIGFYLIYFMFIDKEDTKKTKIFYCTLLLISAYIGFKRTVLVAFLIIAILVAIIKISHIKFRQILKIIGYSFIILSLGYVSIIKTGVFDQIVNQLGLNLMGRQTIYKVLSDFYELSPFYLGKGYAFTDIKVHNITGYAAHNTTARMYAELGCIPFIIWMYWYLIVAPIRVNTVFGKKAGLMILLSTCYLFSMYFIDNSLNYYCIQYSFMLITILLSKQYIDKEKVKIKNSKDHINAIQSS